MIHYYFHLNFYMQEGNVNTNNIFDDICKYAKITNSLLISKLYNKLIFCFKIFALVRIYSGADKHKKKVKSFTFS